tara:strand:+ start:177 stop:1775 length:1599 start_codon:yes stop_codon:yes gene_type:complete
MKNFYDKVSLALKEILNKDFDIELNPPLWELPQRLEFGDLSSMVALRLASKLKEDPLQIAGKIKLRLAEVLVGSVKDIEVLKPGFINIFISVDVLKDSLNEVLEKESDFFRHNFRKKVLIEFLSANPTGPLSIAHGRQAVVGDSVAKVLEFCGNTVEREYYLNDAGRQIELFKESLLVRLGQLKGEDVALSEGGYKGQYIEDIAKKYLEEKKTSDISKFGIGTMIDLIKEDLKNLGIKKFDKWFSQKEIINNKTVEAAIKDLKAKDLIYEKDGALWFSATKFGDDKDRVIKKADGELTYFASDIAYHRDKAKRKFGQLINLWGPDHHGYIKRVKTALTALGFKEEILKVIIIQLVTLKTKERMSKRAGTFVLLSELINNVGKDATRFYYLMRKNSSHLEFDIDLAKQTSFDNPLYYIQYVCARINSIFTKAEIASFDQNYTQYLSKEEEFDLLRTLLQFSYCLEKAYYSLEPVFIIEFLKNLASAFHKFYEKVKVIDKDNNLTLARSNLLKAVLIVFHSGLNLLGIKPVEKM